VFRLFAEQQSVRLGLGWSSMLNHSYTKMQLKENANLRLYTSFFASVCSCISQSTANMARMEH